MAMTTSPRPKAKPLSVKRPMKRPPDAGMTEPEKRDLMKKMEGDVRKQKAGGVVKMKSGGMCRGGGAAKRGKKYSGE